MKINKERKKGGDNENNAGGKMEWRGRITPKWIGWLQAIVGAVLEV